MPLPSGYEWTDKAKYLTSTVGGTQYRDYTMPSREEIEADKDTDPTAEWDWQNQEMLGPQGQALPKYAEGWQPNGEADYGTGFSGWLQKAKSKVETAFETGYTEGMRINEYKRTSAFSGEKKTAGELTTEQAGQKSKAGLTTAYAEAGKEVFTQALWGVLEGLSAPAKAAEKSIGAIGLTIGQGLDLNGKLDEQFKRNYQASELAYSSIFDASIFEEMNRRLDAGMRSDLAAQEIMIEDSKPIRAVSEKICYGLN